MTIESPRAIWRGRRWRAASRRLCFWRRAPRRAGIAGSLHDFTDTGRLRRTRSGPSGGACAPATSRTTAQPASRVWTACLWSGTSTTKQTTSTRSSTPNYVPGTTLLCYDCHDDTTITGDDDPPELRLAQRPAGPPRTSPLTGTARDRRRDNELGYYETASGRQAPRRTGGRPRPTARRRAGTTGRATPCGRRTTSRATRSPARSATTRTTSQTGIQRGLLPGSHAGTATGGHARSTYGTDLRNEPTTAQPEHGTGTRRHRPRDVRRLPRLLRSTASRPGDDRRERHAAEAARPASPQHQADRARHRLHRLPRAQQDQRVLQRVPRLPAAADAAEAGNRFDKHGQSATYAENYPGGAGAHQRHKDALGDAIFDCEICHGPRPRVGDRWHNDGNGTVATGRLQAERRHHGA